MPKSETPARDVRVILPEDALRAVFAECDHYDHDETGGRLLGVYRREEGQLEIQVTGIIEPGPNARRTSTSFFQDGDYQASVFRRLEAKYPSIEHLGNWHTHHVNGYPTLSGGDRETYHRNVNHETHNTDFFYALLVVARHDGAEDLERYRVRHYVLYRADETVYEIPARQVTLVKEPCIWPTAHSGKASAKALVQPPVASSRADDQKIFNLLYPDLQAFLSKRTQTVGWKGPLQLIDDSTIVVNIAEVGAEDYRVLIKQSPVACASIREALMEQGYPSAAVALRSAESALNRSLYASRAGH